MIPVTWRAGFACIAVTVVAGVVFSASPAHADGEQVVKYGQTFTHVSGSTFSVTIDGSVTSLHVVGNPQSWICSHNNVGPGVLPCVPGQTYTFTDTTTVAGAPCAYLQSDEGNVFDTVPGDPSKAVCFPVMTATPTATPTPTVSPTEVPSSTPIPIVTPSMTSPSSTPTPETTKPATVSSVSTLPSSSPKPSASPMKRLGPAPQITAQAALPPELAHTGSDRGLLMVFVPVSAFAVTLGVCLIVLVRRFLPRYKRSGR